MKKLQTYGLLLIFAVIFSGQITAARAQTATPTPNSSPQTTPTPAASPQAEADKHIREGLKGIAEESRTLIGWGLAIIGASIIAIASTSYVRPTARKVRLFYLLFIPGWILVGLSVWNGESVSRRYAAAVFAQERRMLLEIGKLMNAEFSYQMDFMHWGLGMFGLWLFAYVLWWIFGTMPETQKT